MKLLLLTSRICHLTLFKWTTVDPFSLLKLKHLQHLHININPIRNENWNSTYLFYPHSMIQEWVFEMVWALCVGQFWLTMILAMLSSLYWSWLRLQIDIYIDDTFVFILIHTTKDNLPNTIFFYWSRVNRYWIYAQAFVQFFR